MKLKLIYDHVNAMELSQFIPIITREIHKTQIVSAAGKEHYKLLAYLSMQLNNINIVELGTHNGTSSTAMSINSTNSIRTYDVVDIYTIKQQPTNVTRIIGNIFNIHEEHYLLEADFIFLDTAHLGDFELQVFEYLRDNNYKGFIVYDDIHFSSPMKEFWNKIPSDIKMDISKFGHETGTGLIDFNNNVEIINE